MTDDEIRQEMLKSTLAQRFLPFAILKDAYVFHNGKFWKVIEVDGGIQMQECTMAEMELVRQHPGMIVLLNRR